MSALAKLESQWKAFKHDEPGHRFEHQHERMKQSGRAWVVAMASLGAIFLVGGIIMLFIPGPGLLVSLFGLAMIAGASQPLARALDRAEPAMREKAREAKRSWKTASRAEKGVLIGIAAAYAIAIVLVMVVVVGVYRAVT
jgi:hypothetical protein